MNQTEQGIFFSLLRISLWNREKDKLYLYGLLERGDILWQSILKLFEDHALLGVVADAILSLSKHIQLNEQQQNHILQYVANAHQKHFQTQQAIVEVFSKLEDAGCKPILLKGEGLAQIYPPRCFRACGDVDVYVGTKDFDKAVGCMKSLCEKNDVDLAKYGNHDYSIKYKGIPFEIHFKPGYASVEKAEQKFQELAIYWLTPEKCQTITILGKQILIPAAQYNILYVFEHLARHYRNSELGIRQFLDWALLLEKTEFQESVLKIHLEKLQVLDAWCRLAGILHYGLAMENVPFFESNYSEQSKEIMKVVLSRGNFAQQLTAMESKGGIYYILSLFKKSKEIGLVFPEFSKKWLSMRLKETVERYFKIKNNSNPKL